MERRRGLQGQYRAGRLASDANLKKAGAIIIGMTNTPEFSMRGFTDNPLHGPTLNPWDSTITCRSAAPGLRKLAPLPVITR
jgi:hypothetical protein